MQANIRGSTAGDNPIQPFVAHSELTIVLASAAMRLYSSMLNRLLGKASNFRGRFTDVFGTHCEWFDVWLQVVEVKSRGAQLGKG